jgi:DNA (cytosine-5)-methyltransferase 1
MMGLPAGWVTDPQLGLSRTDQLRCIGNGVVPQQAIAAFRSLIPHVFSLEGAAS